MINTTGFGVAFAKSEVDGAAHFFVEEDVFGAAVDTGVVAEGEFAEVTSTVVDVEHVQEVVLTLAGTGFVNFTFAENEADAFNGAAIVGGGDVELDDAVGTVFNGTGEKFAAGEVAFAVAVDEGAVGDG